MTRDAREMGFWEHIEELRHRLITTLATILGLSIVSYFFADYLIEAITQRSAGGRAVCEDRIAAVNALFGRHGAQFVVQGTGTILQVRAPQRPAWLITVRATYADGLKFRIPLVSPFIDPTVVVILSDQVSVFVGLFNRTRRKRRIGRRLVSGEDLEQQSVEAERTSCRTTVAPGSGDPLGPVLVVVESVENPVGSRCQFADDATSLGQRLQAGVNDSEVGSSGFGVGDSPVPVEIERLEGSCPLSCIIAGLLVRGVVSSW